MEYEKKHRHLPCSCRFITFLEHPFQFLSQKVDFPSQFYPVCDDFSACFQIVRITLCILPFVNFICPIERLYLILIQSNHIYHFFLRLRFVGFLIFFSFFAGLFLSLFIPHSSETTELNKLGFKIYLIERILRTQRENTKIIIHRK